MKISIAFLLFCLCSNGFAQDAGSPYLLVSTKDAIIPLKSSETDVQIAGTIAHVRVTQVYQNKGKQPIESKYVFPLSTLAAVHKMQMSIGERTVNAKIFERQEAQKVNNSAVGAAATVVGKTKFRKSFRVVLEEGIPKTEQRRITLEFKGLYSKLVNKYLATYESLRVRFNAKGEIIRIERMENGKWVSSEEMTRAFAKFSTKTLNLDKEMILTLTR